MSLADGMAWEEEYGKPDLIQSPPHYARLNPEPIDIIEAWGLQFHLANVLKYIARAGHKDDELQDLKKARWYLDRKIQQIERDAAAVEEEIVEEDKECDCYYCQQDRAFAANIEAYREAHNVFTVNDWDKEVSAIYEEDNGESVSWPPPVICNSLPEDVVILVNSVKPYLATAIAGENIYTLQYVDGKWVVVGEEAHDAQGTA